jgi:hypothetical protein
MRRENAKLLERVFFSFCQKIKDGKSRWQIVGDALRCKTPRKSRFNSNTTILGT